VWPLPRSQRVALIEGDVVLIHLVDLDAFIGSDTSGLGRITELRTKGDEVTGFVVEIKGGEMHISARFLNDVLYGFQTVESAREQIVAMAIAATRDSTETPEPARAIARADTIAQTRILARAQREGTGPALVTVPLEHFGKLREAFAQPSWPGVAEPGDGDPESSSRT
jgi:hypothetical protein